MLYFLEMNSTPLDQHCSTLQYNMFIVSIQYGQRMHWDAAVRKHRPASHEGLSERQSSRLLKEDCSFLRKRNPPNSSLHTLAEGFLFDLAQSLVVKRTSNSLFSILPGLFINSSIQQRGTGTRKEMEKSWTREVPKNDL